MLKIDREGAGKDGITLLMVGGYAIHVKLIFIGYLIKMLRL